VTACQSNAYLYHYRLMAGWLANLSGEEAESEAEKSSVPPEAPAIILTLTPGRSGTHYLASLFSILPNVYSVHEPDPTLSSREFAQGELNAEEAAVLINEKADSILTTFNNSIASTYVETSHALLSHTSLPSPLIERLLENLEGQSVGVIILRRDLAEVMLSRSHLGHMTCYTQSHEIRYRGVGWIYTPESQNAHIPSIKPDDQLTQLELLAGYVLNVEAVAENFEQNYKAHPRLRIYKIALEELSRSVEKTAAMLDYFNLVYKKEDLIKVINSGKTNERKEDKEFACVRDKCEITLDDCQATLEDYRNRLESNL
jgi:hypothetical protein